MNARRLRRVAAVIAVGVIIAAGIVHARPWLRSSADFREFRLTSSDIPVGIAAAADGTVWFTLEASDAIGRLKDGEIVKVPKGGPSVEPLGLAVDGAGRAWYTEATRQRISRASPDGSITSFGLSTPVARLGRLAIAPSGDVWFAETSLVSVTHLREGRLTRHVVGSFGGADPMDGAPFGVAIAPDGAVWATLQRANKLLRIAAGGEKVAFDVPTRTSGLGDVAVGTDGAVWFLELAANKVGRFADGRFEEFSVPTPRAGLTGLAVAPDGAAWFTELRSGRLGRLHAGTLTEFALPRADARPFGLTVDAANNVWYTDLGGWLGRLDAAHARAR